MEFIEYKFIGHKRILVYMIQVKIVLFSILSFLIMSLPVTGQETGSAYDAFIFNLSQYRATLLLGQRPSELDSLSQVITSWNKETQKGKDFEDIIFSLTYSLIVHRNDFHSFKRFFEKRIHNGAIRSTLDHQRFKLFKDNIEILQLIGEGVLNPQYPFKIERFEIQEELDFYAIQRGERIGEVGAGTGVFGMILNMLGLDVDYYLNEIDPRLLNHQVDLSKEPYWPNDPDRFHLIQGTKTNTNFPQLLDKIIVRNAFHHFIRRRSMLRSIYDSLIQGGELYLMEPTQEVSGCSMILKPSRIVKLVTSKFFVLDQKVNLNGVILYRFHRR